MLWPRRVTISISPADFAAIASTLPNGSTAGGSPDGQGGYLVTLDRRVLARLAAMRGPGESYSDVILRLAASSTLTVVVTAPGLTYVAAPAGGSAAQPNGGHYAVLDGTAGNATLNAANGVGAALVGGDGDTLNGAHSGKDTFVAMGDFGQITINGYIGKATGNFDVIQLSTADFGNNPAAIFNDAKQMGHNTVITDPNPMHSQDTITLTGVSLSSLHFDASHFLLV
jgi:hypothetical protein